MLRRQKGAQQESREEHDHAPTFLPIAQILLTFLYFYRILKEEMDYLVRYI